ncbi:MAG: Bax inhibitor-1/YccA family protein [Candidatus Absconditabacteria bacterium]
MYNNENPDYQINQAGVGTIVDPDTTIARTFLRLSGLIGILGGTAVYTNFLINTGVLSLSSMGILSLIGALAGLGMVFYISSKRQSFSYATLASLLVGFAALEGFSLSFIFYQYSLATLNYVFLLTSGIFVGMAILGYVFKMNYGWMGTFLMGSIIGIIIVSLVNLFIGNETLSIGIAYFGVVVMSGFIAYDMSNLKELAYEPDRRIELVMAMSFFINFINLFLFLLRIFGSRE